MDRASGTRTGPHGEVGAEWGPTVNNGGREEATEQRGGGERDSTPSG